MTPILPPLNPLSATLVLTAIQSLDSLPADAFMSHQLLRREGLPGSGATTLVVPIVREGGAGQRTRAGAVAFRIWKRAALGARVQRCWLEWITVRALVPSLDTAALRRCLPVFMMFGDNAQELTADVRSRGFGLNQLVATIRTLPDHVRVACGEIKERGEHELEWLLMRPRHAIDPIGARRVVLEAVEASFARLPNNAILPSALRRLFRWMKDPGMVVIMTGEMGTTPA